MMKRVSYGKIGTSLRLQLMAVLAIGLSMAACTVPAAPQTVTVVETVIVEKEQDCGATERYIVSAPLVHPYITAWQGGAEAAAEELGVEIIFIAPAGYSPEKQLEMTESALSLPCIAGVSVMTGVPDILEGILVQAKEMGLGTTQNGSCPDAVNTDLCMATDFYQAGQTVAERLTELMGDEGNVVVAFGEPGNVVDKDRQAGLEDYFAENAPGIEVIGVLIDCDNPEGTVRCAEEALVTYPQMDAYYSLGNLNSVGATVAFPEAGRDDVIVTGVDDAPEIVEGIRQGTVSFTYVQQPYGQGYLAVYIPWMMKHEGVESTAKYLDTRITLVDQSNIDSYQDTMKQNFLEIKELVETEIMK